MTLPSSGQLTATEIQAELNVGLPVTIPNDEWRTLAGKPTGSLVIPTDFHSKSRAAHVGTGGGSTTAASVSVSMSFGAEGTGGQRRIFVTVGWQGTTASSALIASAAIGGVSATIHNQQSNAATTNAGCAIISAFLDAGTSGSVVINFNQADTRNVLLGSFRMVAVTINDGGATQADLGPGAQAIAVNNNLLTNGFALISGVTSLNAPIGDITFGGATEAYEGTLGANVRAGGALSDHLGANAAYPCSISNTVTSGIGGFFISTIVGS